MQTDSVFCKWGWCCVWWIAFTNAAAAQSPISQNPTAGKLIASASDFMLQARATAGMLTRTPGQANSVISARSNGTDPEAWSLQLQTVPIARTVKHGEIFSISFSARAIPTGTAADDAGDRYGEIHVLMAKNDPWEPIHKDNGFRTFTVPHQWHSFDVAFTATRSFQASEIYAALQLGSKQQQLEIRELQLTSHGDRLPPHAGKTKLFYPDANDDQWRQKAEQQIVQNRMAKLTVRVVDALDKPIPNAVVRIEQRRHAYAFGTFVGDVPIKVGDDGARFREQTKRWFNRVTLPRYWADWGTDTPEGKVKADAIASWAASEGFELKTHLLMYPLFIPDRVKAMSDDPVRFRAELEAAMEDALTRTRDLPCVAWDALNELRDVPLVGDVLGKEYYAHVFNRANQVQPNVKWFINENEILTGGSRRKRNLETYLNQIKQLQSDGATIEGIGLQGHFQGSLISMAQVWQILDRLAETGLPLEITEFDIDTDDEETQAQYTRDLMTVFFAHPATTGFTTWGFWEGDMWRPRGAMFRTDWSMKPNGKAWEELVLDRWWTREVLKTQPNGSAATKVFKGNHRVTIEFSGITLSQDVVVLDDREIVLKMPLVQPVTSRNAARQESRDE